MTIKSEQLPHAGGFLLFEASPQYCREAVSFRVGSAIRAGTVIAQLQAGDWQELEPGGSGLSDTAAGIAFDEYDASEASVEGVAIVRGPCVVKASELVWPDGISDQNKATAIEELKALGIIVREGPSTVGQLINP